MRIYIGSDHAGFQMKNDLKSYLEGEGHDVVDLGVFTHDSSDYPDIAREVCEKIRENDGARGILLCGSGVGVSIAANRIKEIRAVLANNVTTVKTARKHNDANVLCMGARHIGEELAVDLIETFLNTDFSGEERHIRRINKIEKL